MASDHHRYQPVGRCIYCGDFECKLTDEHIIPYSLNGNWVLPKSSCLKCQKFTQKIEEVCTFERWGMFSPMRAKFKLQSRRGPRTKIQSHMLNKDGTSTRADFTASSFPAPVFGMVLPPAGILLGNEPTNKVAATIQIKLQSSALNEFWQSAEFEENKLVKIGTIWPTAFLQLLAKIGYSYAAAEIGTPETFLPLLREVILGKSDKAPHLIGGSLFVEDIPKKSEYCHHLQVYQFNVLELGRSFTAVAIHLFGQLRLPRYHVIVREGPVN